MTHQSLSGSNWTRQTLQRRAPNMAHKGRCNTFNLLHNFLLKSIPIEGIMQ